MLGKENKRLSACGLAYCGSDTWVIISVTKTAAFQFYHEQKSFNVEFVQ